MDLKRMHVSVSCFAGRRENGKVPGNCPFVGKSMEIETQLGRSDRTIRTYYATKVGKFVRVDEFSDRISSVVPLELLRSAFTLPSTPDALLRSGYDVCSTRKRSEHIVVESS